VIRVAGAFIYGVLVFLGTAGLGFVLLPAIAIAAGLFTIEAEARGAFSLVTLKAVPVLAGLSAAAALSYEWLVVLPLGRRVVVYSATTFLVWVAGAAVAVVILG
jgi:hypothetical protein